MSRVARMRDARGMQGPVTGRDGGTRRRRVRSVDPGPTLRVGAPEWPVAGPWQTAAISRPQAWFVDGPGWT